MYVKPLASSDLAPFFSEEHEGTPWWRSRGDFHTAQPAEENDSSDDEDEERDGSEDDEIDCDDRPMGLTECSLSSSVVPRSEGTHAGCRS